LRKNFSCTNCTVVCSFKSNIIRHYKEIHGLDKEEIPLSVMRIRREQKPLIPCPTCGKRITQLSNHKCKNKPVKRKIKPQISAQTKPVTVSLERLTAKQIAKFQKTEQIANSNSRITRSKAAATGSKIKIPIKLLPSPLNSKTVVSESESESESESSATVSENETSVEEEDTDSDISIAKPKKAHKAVRSLDRPSKIRKFVQKSGVKLPPRQATWRSPADIPVPIKEHIRKVFSDLTYSNLQDLIVRMRLGDGSFNFQLFQILINNSVGRCGVDAINLIKLVYDEQRACPIHNS